MSWFRVKVISEIGTEFGVVRDLAGELTLVARRPGESWPHGKVPEQGTTLTILDGRESFVVEDDGYSLLPSVGEE